VLEKMRTEAAQIRELRKGEAEKMKQRARDSMKHPKVKPRTLYDIEEALLSLDRLA